MHSAFISYSRDDVTRVEELDHTLRENGVTSWRDQDSLYGGQQWPKAIGEAIAAYDYFLLIWSKNAADSHFVEFEWTTAIALRKAIIPCLLDDTPLPPSLQGIHGIGIKDLHEALPRVLTALQTPIPEPAQARHNAEVIDKLQEIQGADPVQVVGQAKAAFDQKGWSLQGNVYQAEGDIIFNIQQFPAPNGDRSRPTIPDTTPHNIPQSSTPKAFLGREQALNDLHNRLQQNKQVAITAVQGMGGIGKTELAIQYAFSNLEAYPGGIVWVNARADDIGIQMLVFAEINLDLSLPDDLKLEDRVALCWNRWRTEGEVLAVFDDVRDFSRVQPFLPPQPSRFKVLVTTRLRLRNADKLSIDVLDERSSLQLLREWIGRDRVDREKKHAKDLCRSLGYLPLALQLVGNYLERRKISLPDMIDRLSEKGLEHQSLEVPQTDRVRGLNIERGVKAAFELSWADLSEKARQLGYVLSLFAQAPIQWALLKKVIPSERLEETEDACVELLGAHLLQGDDPYLLHQLTREFFREKLDRWKDANQLKKEFASAMAQAASRIPQSITIKQVEELTFDIPHISEVADTLRNSLSDEDLDWPFIGLGRFYQGQGLYPQAEPWFEKCLEVCQNRLGDEHPYVAASLNNLAELYYAQGRYEEAEPLFLRALKISEKVLGPEHPDVATSLNNLAALYHAQGRYEEAEPLYLRALKIIEKVLGPEHPDVATSLNNLAGLYRVQGRYEEAEPLYLRALNIREKVLGPEHPSVATSLNNLALLYDAQGRYEEAEPLYLRALKISEKMLGPEHPTTKTIRGNLGRDIRRD
jgi:tetratricopeptide (TPR) repeat protein